MKKYIGNKAFYSMIFAIMLPMIVQQAVTQLVSVCDNVMIGRLGTEQMSGVAIVNELIFVFNLAVFGGISGASIFGAQFFGKGDFDGVKSCHRFKVVICLIFSAVAIAVLAFFGEPLISLYIHEDAVQGAEKLDLAATMAYAKQYMTVMLVGLVPFALAQVYASTIKESGNTFMPMVASSVAVATNCILNYVLIFGKFGFPQLGVIGGALATVISRFAEFGINAIYAHVHKDKFKYLDGVYTKIKFNSKLTAKILKKGSPLIVNEILWSVTMAILHKLYSERGISAVSATNITSTVTNLFSVVYFAIGSAVAIVIGQNLGAGEIEKAKDNIRKIVFFNVVACAFMGIVMICFAKFIPNLYNTTQDVKILAFRFLVINGLLIPVFSLAHCFYFILRSGGNTLVTFLFDSMFNVAFVVPLVFVLVRFTSLRIEIIFLIGQGTDIIKAAVGGILVKKGYWIHNIVSGEK